MSKVENVYRVLRVRQQKTTIFLRLADRCNWGSAKEQLAEHLGIDRKEVDFCLSLDAKKGVSNQEQIEVTTCYLTIRKGGKWTKPSATPFEASTNATIFPEALVDFILCTRSSVIEK